MDQWWSDWLFLVLGGVLGLKPVLPGKRWHPEPSCVFVQLGTTPKCNHMWHVYKFICTCKILSIIAFRYTCTYTYVYILSHNTCIYTPLIEGWMQVPLVNFSCLWFLQIVNQNRLPLCFLRCADAVDANYPSTLGLLGLVMPLGSGTQFIHDSLMATFQQVMSWRFLFCCYLYFWCLMCTQVRRNSILMQQVMQMAFRASTARWCWTAARFFDRLVDHQHKPTADRREQKNQSLII